MTNRAPKSSPSFPALVRPFQEFVGEEASGGVLLLAAAVAALAWANLPGGGYEDAWSREAFVDVGAFAMHLTVREWVNDALMALFFFVVGLEIKREFLGGELSDRRRAALPVAAAVGGMLAPALIYALVNAGEPTARGWGIPMATDIAFALGLLSLLSRRVPLALRAFVLALAIVDDIGGIAVIAVFYTDDVSLRWLAAAAAIFGAAGVLAAAGRRNAAIYALAGIAGWLAMHESGIHATIAGVAAAAVLPVRYGGAANAGSLIDSAEELLHPWSSYLVVPVFALANAGIDLGGGAIGDAASSDVAVGAALGLVIGKPVGILAFSALAVWMKLATLPEGVRWRQIAGAGMVSGVGFTVAIFIATLAFDERAAVDEAKIGILAASVVSGAVGVGWLAAVSPKARS